AAVRVARKLELDAQLLRALPGVRLVREQDGGSAVGPATQGGAQVEAPAPGIVDAAQPEPVAGAGQEHAAVAQHAHAGALELAFDGVGASPEIVVAKAGEDAVGRGNGSDRLGGLPGESRRVVHDVASDHQEIRLQARGAAGDGLQPLAGDVTARVQV